MSFAPAWGLRGFGGSFFGLFGGFVPFEVSDSELTDMFEFDEENLELRLVIHEFRLPI